MPNAFPVLADIEAAADRISWQVQHTPFLPSLTLSQLAGTPVSLKFENLQFTASFKERGALNKILSLDESARRRGFATVSASNHAQGLAYHARRLGYPGLFYPWESGSTGDLATECQSWQPPHCLTQIHLQSDIALAVWQYYQATGDTAWLRERGWPLLRGIAEFWAGRVTRNADGSYSIRNAAGPDEYSNGVTDGVFTNAGAATALRDAARAARILGRPAPASWTLACRRSATSSASTAPAAASVPPRTSARLRARRPCTATWWSRSIPGAASSPPSAAMWCSR